MSAIGSKGFDYNTATPQEIVDECNRRARARSGYRGEEPPTPDQQRRRTMELEKALQLRVIEVYKRAHCKVRSTSQPRKAKFMTTGGADLQIFSPAFDPADFKWDDIGTKRKMWYHEVKLPDGKYSDAQLEFAADCREAGLTCIGGGVEEALEILKRFNINSDGPG